MLQDFLDVEADYKEMADLILQFINSQEIRKGEFEGNQYVIEKLDYENFIIYDEVIDQMGNRSILKAQACYRKDLQKAILEKAKASGFEVDKKLIR